MATIYDRGDAWHLVISPNATPVEKINEPTKGYKATLGEEPDGRHVVMEVYYNKDRYSINEVTNNVEKLKNCSKCHTLDKQKMSLDSVVVDGAPAREPLSSQTGFSTVPGSVGQVFEEQAQQVKEMEKSPSPLKDIFADVFFDAYLTTPGKYFFGMLLQDNRMLESALPKDDRDIPQFMDEMVDFMSGELDFVRSKDEIKEYLSILRKYDEDTRTPGNKGRSRKRKGVTGPSILIY